MIYDYGDNLNSFTCLRLFPILTRWYRAQVLALLEDGSAEVFYVDYGDKETVGKERLRTIPEKFQQLSFQAIECQLANVTKIGMFVQLVRKDSIEH